MRNPFISRARTARPRATRPLALAPLLGLALLTGCYVSKSSDQAGKENVQIQTPVGGMHIKTESVQPADLGLPEYPGAVRTTRHDHQNGSADVSIGFGSFQMRVKALQYRSDDSRDAIIAFYKKALSRYGDVIECQNDRPVSGGANRTREGLTCSQSNGPQVNTGDSHNSFELKAGSEQHQHLVTIHNDSSRGTEFGLISLELPRRDSSEPN